MRYRIGLGWRLGAMSYLLFTIAGALAIIGGTTDDPTTWHGFAAVAAGGAGILAVVAIFKILDPDHDVESLPDQPGKTFSNFNPGSTKGDEA
jgi:hypothetical protein